MDCTDKKSPPGINHTLINDVAFASWNPGPEITMMLQKVLIDGILYFVIGIFISFITSKYLLKPR